MRYSCWNLTQAASSSSLFSNDCTFPIIITGRYGLCSPLILCGQMGTAVPPVHKVSKQLAELQLWPTSSPLLPVCGSATIIFDSFAVETKRGREETTTTNADNKESLKGLFSAFKFLTHWGFTKWNHGGSTLSTVWVKLSTRVSHCLTCSVYSSALSA